MIPRVPIDIHMPVFGVLAETGIVGFTIFSALVMSVIGELYLTIRRRDNHFTSVMAIGALSSFAGFVALLCFMPSFSNEIGWLLMGLAVALTGIRSIETSAAERDREPQALS
jgi:hypothetical protein